jgi:hypothetical protein
VRRAQGGRRRAVAAHVCARVSAACVPSNRARAGINRLPSARARHAPVQPAAWRRTSPTAAHTARTWSSIRSRVRGSMVRRMSASGPNRPPRPPMPAGLFLADSASLSAACICWLFGSSRRPAWRWVCARVCVGVSSHGAPYFSRGAGGQRAAAWAATGTGCPRLSRHAHIHSGTEASTSAAHRPRRP